jgi:3-phytase/alkaline phosphatase D
MRRAFIILITLVATACVGLGRSIGHPELPPDLTTLTLVGQYSIPSGTLFPPEIGLAVGGISGLSLTRDGTELLGISDAQQGGRVYRFRVEFVSGALRVTPVELMGLETPSNLPRPDHESIVLLPDRNVIVSSEGTGRDPRLPPALGEYGPQGQFIRVLPLRDRYVPEPTGPQTRGARSNAGFESVTISPDGERLFAGTEMALVQDGEPATFETGSPSRILEYKANHDSYEPAREFVYVVEHLDKPEFEPATFVNGLVDLLALSRTTMLALERGYMAESGDNGRSLLRIRLYKITLKGASDVSKLDSLKGHSEVVPVKKTMLLDLSTVQELGPELTHLDNFEGMTFGPRLPDGRRSLILASDDNFNPGQRTWFLLFAIQ